GVVELLKDGNWQVAPAPQPYGEAEPVGPIESADVPEADLRVAVERRGFPGLPGVEGRFAGDPAAVLVLARDVGEVSVQLVVGREPVRGGGGEGLGNGSLPLVLERRHDGV